MVFHPRNPCNYMDYYSFTDAIGMEGWVGWVGWSTADTLPTKWLHVNHRSVVDQEKFASWRPTFWPLSHSTDVLGDCKSAGRLWLGPSWCAFQTSSRVKVAERTKQRCYWVGLPVHRLSPGGCTPHFQRLGIFVLGCYQKNPDMSGGIRKRRR